MVVESDVCKLAVQNLVILRMKTLLEKTVWSFQPRSILSMISLKWKGLLVAALPETESVSSFFVVI